MLAGVGIAIGGVAWPAFAGDPAIASGAPRLDSGIDVSWHSGTVDWHAVRTAGHTFAYLKATEGVDLADPAFSGHWRAARQAGVVRGAYHFYVTEDDPEAQARFFISKVVLEPGDLVPVVDVETVGHGTPPGLAARLRRFCDLLEAHYGVRPVIYTSPTFWDRHLDDSFGHHPLWIAEYGVDSPTVPEGWERWHLWQWQEDATIPGVEKGADVSRVNLELGDLAVLMIPEPPSD
jgi:lysozyme